MLDLYHLPNATGAASVELFIGSSPVAGQDWMTWRKPRGKSMINILLIGRGGNGGAGAIGANSTAAGGGGGGSGGQTQITIPLILLPDILYISLAGVGTNSSQASFVTIQPKMTAGSGSPIANDVLIMANGGANGGAAAGATAGAAGAGGGSATGSAMPLGFNSATTSSGQAGIIGGVAVTAANLTLPLTGLLVTGGTGGGGLPAAATAGTNGGSINGAGAFPTILGGVGSATATTAADSGLIGTQPISKLMYYMGGTGGASTHGTATGGGLVQSNGGNGAYGCGGGGSGGALTGSVAGRIGFGGQAICIVTCW